MPGNAGDALDLHQPFCRDQAHALLPAKDGLAVNTEVFGRTVESDSGVLSVSCECCVGLGHKAKVAESATTV